MKKQKCLKRNKKGTRGRIVGQGEKGKNEREGRNKENNEGFFEAAFLLIY